MARILLILLAIARFAHADLPGETGALWNQQSGAPKTLRPDPTDARCIRVTGSASGPRLCSLDGLTLCIDMDNNSATCEIQFSADGTFANADLQATADNRMEVLNNDLPVTPDPTCANRCPAGSFCVLDTDDSINDRWSLCDGITEVAALSDLVITAAWQQPFGAAGSVLMYAPVSSTCECFICPFLRPMISISHLGYRPGLADPDDIVSYGIFSANGQTRYFNCSLNVTSTGAKECSNTLSVGPIPIGNNICCIAASAGATNAFRAAGDSELLVMKYTQSCPGGIIPATLTGSPPTFTRQLSAVPFVDFVFGVGTTTSSTSTTSTSTSSSTSSTSAVPTTTVPTTTSTSSTSSTSSSTTSTSSTTSSTTGGGGCTAPDADYPACDTFERAALGTTNWTNIAAANHATCVIDGNSDVDCNGGTTSIGLAMWTEAQAQNTAGYACVQLSRANPGGYTCACLGVGNATGDSAVCCCVTIFGGAWEMDQIGNTSEDWTGGPLPAQATPVFVVGDYLGIERHSASTARCYRATAAAPTTWTPLFTGDSTISARNPGAPGIYDDAGTSMLELFEAGNGTLPTDAACGTHN